MSSDSAGALLLPKACVYESFPYKENISALLLPSLWKCKMLILDSQVRLELPEMYTYTSSVGLFTSTAAAPSIGHLERASCRVITLLREI